MGCVTVSRNSGPELDGTDGGNDEVESVFRNWTVAVAVGFFDDDVNNTRARGAFRPSRPTGNIPKGRRTTILLRGRGERGHGCNAEPRDGINFRLGLPGARGHRGETAPRYRRPGRYWTRNTRFEWRPSVE